MTDVGPGPTVAALDEEELALMDRLDQPAEEPPIPIAA
jgi:hypothetical protein